MYDIANIPGINLPTLKNKDIVKVTKGRKGDNISYLSNGCLPSGKVILFKNKPNIGWAQVDKVVDKGNYFLCEGKNVPYDLYPEITYEEFLEVLKYNQFKIGFDIPFRYTHEGQTSIGRHIFAYNLRNNSIIQAVTNYVTGGNNLGEVELEIPNDTNMAFDNICIVGGTHTPCTYSILIASKHEKHGVIHSLMERADEITEHDWGNNMPFFCSYSDEDPEYTGLKVGGTVVNSWKDEVNNLSRLSAYTDGKLLLCPREVFKVFINSKSANSLLTVRDKVLKKFDITDATPDTISKLPVEFFDEFLRYVYEEA